MEPELRASTQLLGCRDPEASRTEGRKHLPALVATEGQRKAWKLEAQSSLTVPMVLGDPHGTRQAGAGSSRQRHAGLGGRQEQAAHRQGGRRIPALEAAGKAALAGQLQLRSPRASPACPRLHGSRSAPNALAGGSEPLKRTRSLGTPQEPPHATLPAPSSPVAPQGAGCRVFLEQFYPSVLER